MASNRKQIQEDTHLRILRLLNENPEISTREIADLVGISNGGAYYCLNALIEKGLIKIGNFSSSKHKNRYAYILTPRGISEKASLTKRFLVRKRMEFEALKDEIDALETEIHVGSETGID
ncbi:MAG: MarR family EPS-associated transcriptional regulator [Rhizobiaceae bacterium]